MEHIWECKPYIRENPTFHFCFVFGTLGVHVSVFLRSGAGRWTRSALPHGLTVLLFGITCFDLFGHVSPFRHQAEDLLGPPCNQIKHKRQDM